MMIKLCKPLSLEDFQNFDKPLYIFGYGSLMYPDGINCRGLSRKYNASDFHYLLLKNFKRELNIYYLGTYFYGMKTEVDSRTYGAIIPISVEDLYILTEDERSAPLHNKEVYILCDISSSVDIDGIVVTFLSNNKYIRKPSSRQLHNGLTFDYIKKISKGLEQCCDVGMFKKTGGIII